MFDEHGFDFVHVLSDSGHVQSKGIFIRNLTKRVGRTTFFNTQTQGRLINLNLAKGDAFDLIKEQIWVFLFLNFKIEHAVFDG